MPSKLELTFFKSKKQWKKKKHDRVVYLGHGDGKNDLASYRVALAKWRQIEPKLDEKYRIANDPRTDEEKRVDHWWADNPDAGLSDSARFLNRLARQRGELPQPTSAPTVD